MADDNNRRPLHPSASFGRPPDGAVSAPTGSDPLAELARLIGQTDPFAEFGREGRAPASSPPVAAEPPLDWNARPVRHDAVPAYGNDYAAPQHADVMKNVQPPGRGDFVPGMVPPVAGGYQGAQHAAPGYESAGYFPEHLRGHPDDEHYDDVPPPRRRVSIVAIAGVFALVILGTAGAFGYRALFGSSGSSPPPVIKADANPSKIVPPTSNASSPSKLISDRIGERVQGEKLVSREEQPVDVKEKAAQMPSQAAPTSGPAAAAVTLTEPKKIKTIAIRPDQATTASATDSMPVRPAVAASNPPPQAAPPARVANAPLPLNASEPPPVRQSPPPAAVTHSNGPLSLSAGASEPAPARVASAPVRSAPPASNGGQGLYAVQVSSQRSEADAQASFQALQGRYPAQLGNRQAFIRRADLGAKGVYYRALVGPFASAGEASDLCSSLKAAGASCIIQRN